MQLQNVTFRTDVLNTTHFMVPVNAPIANLFNSSFVSFKAGLQQSSFHSAAAQFHEILQCRNCQRLGHAVLNCNLPYSFVKCNTPHSPRQCLKTSQQNPTYVNCDSNTHPTNNRNCPMFLQRCARQNLAPQPLYQHKPSQGTIPI